MKKTVIITGSSSGFGKETALIFQRNGWNVIATMRSPEKEQELNKLENVLVTALDVEDEASIHAAVAEGIARFGGIDVLINNAGYGHMGVFESAKPADIRKQFDVNVFGMMTVTQAVLAHLRKNDRGAIVNISSFGGIVALPFGSLYGSSKFAVEGFSEALSHELASFNIQVKIVEPGSVSTNFRSGAKMIDNKIEEYNPLVSAIFSRYGSATEKLSKATPDEVAEVIFNAATDGTSQLRYVVGEDAKFWIDTKTRNDEADFIDIIRNSFLR